MDMLTLLAVAVGLAMDAFAVAIATGIRLGCTVNAGHVFRMASFFGFFQFMMTVLGWFGGVWVQAFMQTFDHWIAMSLLLFIGGKMIWEAFHKTGEKGACDPTTGLTLLGLSVATSIDAFAVGLSLGVLRAGVLRESIVIGLVAAAFTVAGMRLGTVAHRRMGRNMEVAGGIILIAIGLRIVAEHMIRGV